MTHVLTLIITEAIEFAIMIGFVRRKRFFTLLLVASYLVEIPGIIFILSGRYYDYHLNLVYPPVYTGILSLFVVIVQNYVILISYAFYMQGSESLKQILSKFIPETLFAAISISLFYFFYFMHAGEKGEPHALSIVMVYPLTVILMMKLSYHHIKGYIVNRAFIKRLMAGDFKSRVSNLKLMLTLYFIALAILAVQVVFILKVTVDYILMLLFNNLSLLWSFNYHYLVAGSLIELSFHTVVFVFLFIMRSNAESVSRYIRLAPAPAAADAAAKADEDIPETGRVMERELMESVRLKIHKLLKYDLIFLQEDLTMEKLADELGISRNNMSFFLNGYMGTTYNDLINYCRVEYAKYLLLNEPEMPVERVGYQSGFNSKTSFYRNFTSRERITPLDYRNKYLALLEYSNIKK